MEKKTSPVPMRDILDTYSSKVELAYNGSREDLEPYVPADHRPQEASTSTIGAMAHLLKASLGSGVLAMPLAFHNAGLVVGCFGTIVIGLVCAHAVHILVRTSQQLCKEVRKPCLSYAETCELVFQHGPPPVRRFAPFIREVADWALAFTHIGVCCVYTVVIAETFKQISDVYGGPALSVRAYCVMLLAVIIPLTQVTKLKYLVPFSALANVVWVASICISIYYCLRDIPDISKTELATSIAGIPNFVTTSLFAMEGVGVVLPIENEMDKPHQFLGCPGVLNIAMTAVIILYGFVGAIGYISYGDAVQGSITLNLPKTEILAQVAKVLVACVMLLSFALLYYVPVDVVWRRIHHRVPTSFHQPALVGIRLFGALLSVGLACAIPKIDLFMDLVGAICLSTLGLIIPALIEIIWRWGRDVGPCSWVLLKNSFIFLVALLAMVTGITYSIKSIVENIS